MKIFIPYLHFYLKLPLIEIRTHVLARGVETYTYEYIYLDIKLYKWETRFRLYKPGYYFEKQNGNKNTNI